MAGHPLDDEEHTHNPVIIRRLEEADLPAIVAIDASEMKRERKEYYRDKVQAAVRDSRIHLSLIAELDKQVVGFLMARMHYGEFGRPEPTAVVDSIGVHREFRGHRVGRTLMDQFLTHLRALNVECVRTEVGWNHLELIQFLDRFGYRPSERLVLELKLQ